MTFDTIQDIRTTASPSFSTVTASALTASSLVASSGTKALQSVVLASSNGASLIYAAGTLTATMSQDLQTTASPAFAGVSIYDPNFTITLAGTVTPTITYDTDDTLTYLRNQDTYVFRTAGVIRTLITPTYLHTSGYLYATLTENQLKL